MELQDWSLANFNDQARRGVSLLEHSKTILTAQHNFPTRIVQQIKPIQLILTPKGETVLDMGQNMVGWMHFTVRGEAGVEVALQHAEVLDKAGNFYTGNLRKAKQTIRYILNGAERESYEPHFTFQGFRYVKVDGYPGELNLDDFTGKVICTEMDKTGYFVCSDERINQSITKQHRWGQKGNFLDVPTDCPQRDERLGWTGDAQVFIRTAAYNMNVAPFFTKWWNTFAAKGIMNTYGIQGLTMEIGWLWMQKKTAIEGQRRTIMSLPLSMRIRRNC